MNLIFKNYIYENVNPFLTWFGNSKVVDSNGNPLKVYHATLEDFDEFNETKANKYSLLEGGFYFTDNIEDAEDNYTYGGADNELAVYNKVSTLEFMLPNELYNTLRTKFKNVKLGDIENDFTMDRRDYTRHGKDTNTRKLIIKYAEDEVYRDGEFNIMPCYLKIINPIYSTENNVTSFNKNETETIIKYIKNEKTIEKINNILNEKNNVSIDDLFKINIYQSKIPLYKILNSLGYDGFIMEPNKLFKDIMPTIKKYTLHYIVFNPNQIKSTFNKNPTDSNNITK